MIEKIFYLDDWKVLLLIAYTLYDIKKISKALYKVGCNTLLALEAYDNLSNKKYNTGFTYTNLTLKESVIVIGLLENSSLLINTIAHESRHLQQHISIIRNMDPNGEEVCYLLGKIVLIIYEICVRYLKVGEI